ncbi:hypothetical protein [uncultured Pseudoalteromonas sp.]|mgnify:CR=1 FL=1|uniref:hypothetical protein n=1 Tax=uncultured Pseudoalteromonas sp. TaxID=114053 RepID=UPI0025936407|nr:hypothetical protein [uncultured Pseudoalteromonas sp.]
MDIIIIHATDGDSALFVNGVLISYYDVVTDNVSAKNAMLASAVNLSKALNCHTNRFRLEKNEGFVHWEESEQVSNILSPSSFDGSLKAEKKKHKLVRSLKDKLQLTDSGKAATLASQ